MKQISSDVAIIGGGLIGAAAAISLSDLGVNVVIIEKKSNFSNLKNYDDKRTIAISEGTKKFLSKINVWEDLGFYSQPIKKIKIIDRNFTNILDFDNSRRDSNLGYILKNQILINKLYKKLIKKKNIKIINNDQVYKIEHNSENIITLSNKHKIQSKLLIAADGKNSPTRSMLKTTYFKKNYNKKAFVINITHTANHNAVAYEFFNKFGPLAILPMKKETNNYSSSIVWTNDTEYLEELSKKADTNIINVLEKHTSGVIGNIKTINSKNLFPITAHINSKFYERRLIYIGDSAHSIHPIAGQGWNLGMRDVNSLLKVSKKHLNLGLNLGSNNFCKEYHEDTFYDAYRLYQVTDKLDNIFLNSNKITTIIRSLGFDFLKNNKNFKNFISDFAMGVSS